MPSSLGLALILNRESVITAEGETAHIILQRYPGRMSAFGRLLGGIDFWDLFCRYTPPEYMDLPNLGRMVAIDSSWEPWLVESLHALGVNVIESSIIPRDLYRTPLNLEDVARYRRLAQSSAMPILIPTQKDIRPHQVGSLKVMREEMSLPADVALSVMENEVEEMSKGAYKVAAILTTFQALCMPKEPKGDAAYCRPSGLLL